MVSTVRVVRENPANGKSVRTSRPIVQAAFAGGNVDPNSVRVTLDGRDVTRAAYVSGQRISYTPLSPIPAGPHEVHIQGADRHRATFSQGWRFKSGNDTPVVTISNVIPRAGGMVGRAFTVRGNTRSGATVTIQVSQTIQRRGFFQKLGHALGFGRRPASAERIVTAGRNGHFASSIDINAPGGSMLAIVITSTDRNYGISSLPFRFSVRMSNGTPRRQKNAGQRT